MKPMLTSLGLTAALCACNMSAFAGPTPAHWCDQPTAHPVDAAFDAAIERSGGVTADMRDAQGIAFTGWDGELNRLYRAVLKQHAQPQVEALRRAQRAWLAWDVAETESDRELSAEAGTSGPLTVADLSIERRRTRACTLKRLLDDADP